jgi:hypothetical protein
MTQQPDFKAALDDFDRCLRFIEMIESPYHPKDFFRKSTAETIRRALLIADRLMEEPSNLHAQIEMLKRALEDCADELAAEISSRYGSSVHPAMALRYKRDMQFVEEARQLIDRIESGEWLEASDDQ